MKQSPKRGYEKRGSKRQYGGPPRRHQPKERKRPSSKREMLARGLAADLGMDGNLRVELDPLDLRVAEDLTRGRGAEVFTPRGQSMGNVTSIVGTLERPIAIVRLRHDARRAATEIRGREVFLG